MADFKLSALNPRGTPDRSNDQIYVTNSGAQYRSTINNELGITGNPIGDTDTQSLSNKTLLGANIIGPAINSATLSGTITGTYTLGGTPTFPASVVTLTGSQTLTNKVLTSPTLTNASITQDSVVGFTTANSGTVYGVAVTAGTISGASLTASSVDYTKVATGMAIQSVSFESSAVATGTTIIPEDDTIPQNTEGDQYMSLTIIPKLSTSTLVIQVVFFASLSVTGDIITALFQDATANALAVNLIYQPTATAMVSVPMTYTMTSGTTSATTFKVRGGGNTAATMTFNGQSTARKFGAIPKSSIVITEYKA